MNNYYLRIILISALLLGAVTEMKAYMTTVNVEGINYELYYSVYNPGLNGNSSSLPLYGASYAVVDSAVVAWNYDFDGFADIASSIAVTVTFSRYEYYNDDDPYTGAISKTCTYTWELAAPVTAIGVTYSRIINHNVGGGFSGSGLTGVNIPNTVKYIYACAFSNCSSLTNVMIPNSVTILGTYYNGGAFQNCTNLTNVTINGNSVRVLGPLVFSGCSSLTSINIPNSVKTIDYLAFYKCTSLTSINIPNSVESIGYSAFSNCSSLTSIDIPNSVTSIEQRAFEYCSNLRSVTLGNSIEEIGTNAFNCCNSINRVYINDLSAFCRIKFVNSASNPLCYGHRLFLINNKEIIDLAVPNDVTSINDYAFYGFSGMESLNIPNSVNSIGGYAFYDGTGLTTATIGDGCESIGNMAFSGCSSLNDLSIGNSVNNIGYGAFSSCKSLNSLVLPNSVIEIGESAFGGCNNLTNIGIPQSVTSIGYGAFVNCNKLNRVDITDLDAWCRINFGNQQANPCVYAKKLYLNGEEIIDLVIPNTVTKIGDYAFYNCNGLKSATISNSVIDIGSYAFYLCSGMNNLTLGKSVAYIRQKAFSGCSALTNIYSKSEIAPSMDNTNCFNNNTYNNAIVYVPIGAKRDYELTNYWNLFTNIVEMNMDETPPGDANGDGEVNITDISALIDVILSGEFSSACDVNDDGEINISDINAIIDIILNQ